MGISKSMNKPAAIYEQDVTLIFASFSQKRAAGIRFMPRLDKFLRNPHFFFELKSTHLLLPALNSKV